MKTIPSRQSPLESSAPQIDHLARRQPRPQIVSRLFLCLLLTEAFAGRSSAQTLQTAGDLIVNVQSVDLNATNNVWTNQTIDGFSVGNLSTKGGGAANVASLSYSDAIVGSTNVNALFVSSTGNNSMVSAVQVPARIIGRGTVSAEAWVQATDVGSPSGTITSATVAYGVGSPEHQRDFNYSVGNGNGAVSGYADDSNWTPQTFPTAGVWHYLAYTYDGTVFRAYQDGVLNTIANKPNWNTQSGVLCVGSDGASGGTDPFHGYIAAARVMTGVLSSNQILNNFNLGLLATFDIIPLTPTVTPATNAFVGDTVTLSEVAQAHQALTYQWQSDNGSGGATFANISGATGTNYVLNTTGLALGNYEYQVVVTGDISVTSPPVVIKVNAASGPVLTQNITPATTSNLFVGSSVTFTAGFSGNQTITNQWQKSTDNGATFSDIPGANGSSLPLINLQLSDSGQYRLVATNGIGHGNSSAAMVNVQPLSALPQLQVVGQLLINLQQSDLNTNGTVWTNEINGVGDFSTASGLNLTVSNLNYNFQPVNLLAVNGVSTNAVNSAQQVPTNIIGNNPVSVEAWIYPTTISGNNTVAAYGVQGGGGAPREDREFDFGNSGGGAFSGNFGGDASWNGALTPNTWHYVAYTYDGTTLRCYEDGVQNLSNNNGPLSTLQTVAVVGGGIGGAVDTGMRTDSFQGNIATVRVETGVLSASQIANNYVAGPLRTIAIVLSTPTLSPSNVVFFGDTVTASVTNAQSLQSLTFQWQTDNGSGGATWSNVAGQTGTNYTFSTSTLTPTNYEYQLVATGSGGTIATSAPVTLTVKPAAPPTILADTTPISSVLFVGQQITFAAAFAGNQPISTQWQISTNGGATFNNLAGDTGLSLTLTNLQRTDTGKYRLFASNAFGSTNSTAASLFVLPLSAAPQVQFAGEVIVDLESQGLDTNAGVWHNSSTDSNSVGDFTFVGTTGPLNVATSTYNFQTINVLNVAGNGNNSVEALNGPAPAILLGANPCSMDAWVYATQVSSGNAVVNYGNQSSQSGNLDRSLNYQSQGYGAFTGYFGNADLSWNPAPTANAWHYIAVTYDGSNLKVFQDGVLNNSRSGITLTTASSYISVGSGTGGGPFAGANALSGYVASARVETGVLTASQITQNYNAGPAPGLITGITIAQLAPLTFGVTNGTLTLNWLAGTLQEAASPTGPWTTDTGVTPPFTVNTAVAPKKFYRLQY